MAERDLTRSRWRRVTSSDVIRIFLAMPFLSLEWSGECRALMLLHQGRVVAYSAPRPRGPSAWARIG